VGARTAEFPIKERTMTGPARQALMTHACEPFDVRIRRFPRPYRRRIRKLVRGSKPLTDLIYSFPAAIFVLAAGKRTPDACGQAVKLVKAGEPLARIADALELPIWTRRLPPEAFARPFGVLPGDEDFARQIANLLPATPDAASIWLQSVAFGHEACSSALALWLAGSRVAAIDCGDAMPPLLPLAAYAWFSRRKAEIARQLMRMPWSHQMRFTRAVGETRAWLERVVIEYCLEHQVTDGGWFKPQKSSGYRFIPLRSAAELREEGDRMNNCVATYAGKAASGACMIYSVRRGGRRLATLEIVPVASRQRDARIAQLLGPGNSEPREGVLRAAETWLAKRGRYPAATAERMGHLPVLASRWETVWRPYCEAKPQFSAYLLKAPAQALARLDADLRELEQWREA
jgi:hypothetical protein